MNSSIDRAECVRCRSLEKPTAEYGCGLSYCPSTKQRQKEQLMVSCRKIGDACDFPDCKCRRWVWPHDPTFAHFIEGAKNGD